MAPNVRFRVFLSSDQKLLRKVSLLVSTPDGAETTYSQKGVNMLLAATNVLTRDDSTEDIAAKISEIEAGESEDFAISYGNISLNYKVDPDGKRYEISLSPNQEEKAVVSEPSTSSSTLAQASASAAASAEASSQASATASSETSNASSSASTDVGAGELSTVYVTPSGKSFHRDSCPTLSRSAVVDAISREEASKTRSACKVCKP